MRVHLFPTFVLVHVQRKRLSLFHCLLYFKGFYHLVLSCEFFEATLANEAQLNCPKMCENQKHVSPVVHSSVPVQ